MMKEEKKKGALVPRLRFPEFRDAGEWAGKKIQQIAKIYKGKGISKADISSDGKQLCIRYGELYTSYSEVILEVISKTSLPADTLFLSKINDVIIPASGETKIDIATSSCVMKDDVALGGDLNIIRSCQNGVFISYYVNGNLKEEIAKKAQGDTVVHLYPAQIGQLDIAIPSKKEQQRIADCLSSLDERIAAEADKLDALKSHKNGLLKQLFPAEGETLPPLRFPEFRDARGWEEELIESVAEVATGNKDTQDKVDGGAYPFFVRSQQVESIDAYALDCEAVLTSGDGVGVGKNFHYIEGKFNFHQRVYCIYNFSENVSGKFFFYFFSEKFYKHVMKLSAKNSVDSVRRAMITELSIMIPSLKEQQRIADCLSSLDEIISAQTQKIELLKAHKKGLMQQLFPEIDEAKG